MLADLDRGHRLATDLIANIRAIMGRERHGGRGRAHGSHSTVIARQLRVKWARYRFPIILGLVICCSLYFALGPSSSRKSASTTRVLRAGAAPDVPADRYSDDDESGDDDDDDDKHGTLEEEPPSDVDIDDAEERDQDDDEGGNVEEEDDGGDEEANEANSDDDDDDDDDGDMRSLLFPKVAGSGGGEKSIAALLRRRHNAADPAPAHAVDDDDAYDVGAGADAAIALAAPARPNKKTMHFFYSCGMLICCCCIAATHLCQVAIAQPQFGVLPGADAPAAAATAATTVGTSELQPANAVVSAVAGASAIVGPVEPLKGMLTCKERGGKNKECSRGYAEYRFKVKPRTKYYLWIRGVGPDLFANSLWVGAPGHGPLNTAHCHWPEGVKVPFTVPHKHRPKHGSAKGRDRVVCCPAYLGKNRKAGKDPFYFECCHGGLGPDGHEKGCVFDLEVDTEPKWQMLPRVYHVLKHHGEELAIRIYAREDGTSWTALMLSNNVQRRPHGT